jgi:ribonucleoside-triphosphate reductase
MSTLKMNPSRDAGRFAYHLKFLLKADLIEGIVETKKYGLTDLGKMVIDVADRIERKAQKPKTMLIRASRSAIEEFDANKIATSLMKEARMPAELAQKVAKEAEKQLMKAKTKYLTAPLVREIVNAILIEKGLEEYRHKLTRLGIPVHDVTTLIESKNTIQTASIHEAAGETVLREYILLNVLPRDIADAHLSGALHINNLSTWNLKPTEIMHDIRFFLQNGLNLEKTNPQQSDYSPPTNLETALTLIFNALLHTWKEVDAIQTLDYFNIFLAPYTRDVNPTKMKEPLRLFITNLTQHTNASINLELTIPDFIAEKQAITSDGKQIGTYKDFTEETQQLASMLLDIFIEENMQKPLLNPKLIIKTRPETYINERAKALLLKAHKLASERGTVYFANLTAKGKEQTVHSPTGLKLTANQDGDWETDTLRTGCLGIVTVNIPRIAYETENEKTRFLEIMKERLEMASRALEIKHRALKQNMKSLLPFITQSNNSDQYYRLENSTRTINIAGIREAAEAFTRKPINDPQTQTFIEETAKEITSYIHKIGRKRGKPLAPALLPGGEASERLAQLDVERYGVGKVKHSGTREKPYYSTIIKLTLQDFKIQQEQETLQYKLNELQTGGSLTVIDVGQSEIAPDDLLAATKQLTKNGQTELFTYDRKLTYCVNCKKTWIGFLHKCPSCSAIASLTFYDRFNTA